MSNTELNPIDIANNALLREANYLDDRAWENWLGLYTDNATYWVPAWRDENNETADPNCEISQIYHTSRRELVERAERVTSDKSVTTMPLPRTTHFITNIIATRDGDKCIDVRANCMVQIYQPRTTKQMANFGYYEYRLKLVESTWLIDFKKIHLKNDLVPALIDFYTL